MAKHEAARRARRMAALDKGYAAHAHHPLLRALPYLTFDSQAPPPSDAFLVVTCSKSEASYAGSQDLALRVRPNLARDVPPADWTWALARVRLHAALNHFDPARTDIYWSAACWAVAEALLANAGVGSRPDWLAPLPQGYKLTDERALAQRLEEDLPEQFLGLGLSSHGVPFWTCSFPELNDKMRREATRALAEGVREAASAAVQNIGTTQARFARKDSAAEYARSWFVSNYPLLAALASGFKIIDDAEICERLHIRVAAVSSET
jgi:hypothetical protein